MGTRNLTVVQSGGQYRVAQYGQWDGYPGGQGVTALKFLRFASNRKRLKQRLSKCQFLTEGQISAAYASGEAAKLPLLSRDLGASILRRIADSKGPALLRNEIGFAADSLFCEWAYVVDFDRGTFEVYKGFNKKPVPAGQRFADVVSSWDVDGKYYPIVLVKKYRLADLPTAEKFLKDMAEF